ncbi:extracellular solute-binding protein [Streptomyces sp. NBC_01465]|uniref:extracellular solute-binding protein n=1 Tax=Streptomyces sp. NBC_01465 TaxID=2903878 RepID=UPI002E3757D1|nr:extracellular solute-binding protein [Streptomyces sp. NBC_01465]
MRRGIAATALVAALALAATACGGDDSGSGKSDGPVTITWWDTSNATNEAPNYKALIAKFEKANPTVKVKYVNVPFDTAQNKFTTAAGSKGAPDVLRSDVGWTPGFVKSGFLAPLDGSPAVTDTSAIDQTLVKQAQVDGKTYGVPLVTDTLGLLWNKDLLKKAGFDKAPTTLDELKAVSKAVADKTDADGFWLHADAYYLMPYLYGEGTDMVDAAAKKITINDAAAVKAVTEAKSLLSAPGVHKLDATANKYANMQDAFNNGKVAMIVQGPWELTNIYKGKAFTDKANLGISAVPAGSTGTAGAPLGGHNLVAYAGQDAAHLKASEKFIGYMTSAASQTEITTKNGTLPTRTDAVTPAVKALPGVSEFQALLANGKARPALPEYSSLYADLATNYVKILQGKDSVQSGLDATAKSYKKLVPTFSD